LILHRQQAKTLMARPLRAQPVALWSEFFRHNDGSISAHVGVCDEQYSYRWPARP
jgi:hypothetical protein